MAKSFLKTGLVINIIFTIGINFVETMVNDEKTMVDFFGYSALDIIKGIAAAGVGTAAAIAFAAGGAPIIVSGLIFAGVTLLIGFAINEIDSYLGVSDQLVETLKKGVSQ